VGRPLRMLLALGCAVLLLGVTVFFAHRKIVGPASVFLDEAREAGGHGTKAVEVVLESDRPLDAPRPGGIRLFTSAQEIRDVVEQDGRFFVATSGGAIVAEGGSARLLTTLDGFADVDLRVAARVRGSVVFGGGDGRLTFVGNGRVRVFRVAGAQGPVGAILEHEGKLVVGWLGGGAAVVDPEAQRAVALYAASDKALAGDVPAVAALAAEQGRYAIGTVDGKVVLVEGSKQHKVCAEVPGGRVTALLLAGESVIVGTPLGVCAPDRRGGCSLLRGDLLVTGLVSDGPLLYVATLHDGVHVFERSTLALRPVAHVAAGARVTRLVKGGSQVGSVLAVGPHGVFAVSLGGAREVALPQLPGSDGRLAGGHVTALLRVGGQSLYVGSFEHGITVLSADGQVRGYLPQGNEPGWRHINTLVALKSGEVAAGTIHGILVFGAAGERRIGRKEGLGGEEVTGLAVTREGELLAATNRGLTVFSGPPGREVGRTIGAIHGLASNHTYAVAEGGRTLFVGTLSGLSLLRDLSVVRTLGGRGGPLRHHWVTALVPAAEPGAVWVGTNGGGVARVNEEGGVEVVGGDDSQFHVNPGAMALDPVSGMLLVGTIERGALAVDPVRRRFRELRLPLPSQSVTAILAEKTGVFFGTDRGLLEASREAVGLAEP